MSAPLPFEENYVLAAVNADVVTARDVLVAWRLDRRLNADPDAALTLKDDKRRQLIKEIVSDRLWIAHAKQNPLYGEFVTQRVIDDEAKGTFKALFEDPSVPNDERTLMRTKAEVRIAMQVALQNDPLFKRCMCARPDDVRRYYEMHPEMHRIATHVQLGRVMLSRENAKDLYGEAAETLIEKLRQRAVELGSLENAAKELAPGTYQAGKEYDVEHDNDLREDVLGFAKSATPGDISAAIVGQASVMLFTALTRKEGKDVSFEEAAASIKDYIERRRSNVRAEQYFVVNVLPQAFFRPQDLFDDEIEQFIPNYKQMKARAQAAAAAAAKKGS